MAFPESLCLLSPHPLLSLQPEPQIIQLLSPDPRATCCPARCQTRVLQGAAPDKVGFSSAPSATSPCQGQCGWATDQSLGPSCAWAVAHFHWAPVWLPWRWDRRPPCGSSERGGAWRWRVGLACSCVCARGRGGGQSQRGKAAGALCLPLLVLCARLGGLPDTPGD